jgi:hypothetical protein
MVYNGYYKVMSNIPKMGQLPTPVYPGSWVLQKCWAVPTTSELPRAWSQGSLVTARTTTPKQRGLRLLLAAWTGMKMDEAHGTLKSLEIIGNH